MAQIVEINNVSKKFKFGKHDFYALKDVSLNIEKGEIFGLLGPNGAGKTTLINILTSVLVADEGSIKVDGLDIEKDRYQILERINHVSGETLFHPFLKGKEILKFYCKIYDVPNDKIEGRINELTELFQMKDFLKNKFTTLSKGQKMRLILAKSLVNNPIFLLLDEPTVGLDPDIAIKTREIIKDVNKKLGTTILLTSHYMKEVEELCKRIAFIDKGKIIDIGEIKRLKRRGVEVTEVRAKVAKMINRKDLEKHQFKVKRNDVIGQIKKGDDPSEIVRFLVSKGYDVIGFEIKEPTLEEYFLSMSRDEDES